MDTNDEIAAADALAEAAGQSNADLTQGDPNLAALAGLLEWIKTCPDTKDGISLQQFKRQAQASGAAFANQLAILVKLSA